MPEVLELRIFLEVFKFLKCINAQYFELILITQFWCNATY